MVSSLSSYRKLKVHCRVTLPTPSPAICFTPSSLPFPSLLFSSLPNHTPHAHTPQSPDDWAKAMYTTFLQLDKQLRTMLPRGDRSGCTANVCVVSPDFVVTANAGDARAVLSRAGMAIEMSVDHKPSNPAEERRITAAGGSVLMQRVNGELAVSRALGDFTYKHRRDLKPAAQMVTCAPDVRAIPRLPVDEFLVIACDGVWDVMTSDEVVGFCRAHMLAGTMALPDITNLLLDTCLERCSRDNMTACIVKFAGFAPTTTATATATATATSTATPSPDRSGDASASPSRMLRRHRSSQLPNGGDGGGGDSGGGGGGAGSGGHSPIDLSGAHAPMSPTRAGAGAGTATASCRPPAASSALYAAANSSPLSPSSAAAAAATATAATAATTHDSFVARPLQEDSLDMFTRAAMSPALPRSDHHVGHVASTSPTMHLRPLEARFTPGGAPVAAARTLLTDTLTPTGVPARSLDPLPPSLLSDGASTPPCTPPLRSRSDVGGGAVAALKHSPSMPYMKSPPRGGSFRPGSAPMDKSPSAHSGRSKQYMVDASPARSGRSDRTASESEAGGRGAAAHVPTQRSLFSPDSGRLAVEAAYQPISTVSAPLHLSAATPSDMSPGMPSPGLIDIGDLYSGGIAAVNAPSPVPLFPPTPFDGDGASIEAFLPSAVGPAGATAGQSPLTRTLRRNQALPKPLTSPSAARPGRRGLSIGGARSRSPRPGSGRGVLPSRRRSGSGSGSGSGNGTDGAAYGDPLKSPYAQVASFFKDPPADRPYVLGSRRASGALGAGAAGAGASAAPSSAPVTPAEAAPVTAPSVAAIRARYGLPRDVPAAGRRRRGTSSLARVGSSGGGAAAAATDEYTGLSIDEALALDEATGGRPAAGRRATKGNVLAAAARVVGHVEHAHTPHTPTRARPPRRRTVEGRGHTIRPSRKLSENGKDLFSQTITSKGLAKMRAGHGQ